MAYSEIKVVAGGLAHIPIIIAVFLYIQKKLQLSNKSQLEDKTAWSSTQSKTEGNHP